MMKNPPAPLSATRKGDKASFVPPSGRGLGDSSEGFSSWLTYNGRSKSTINSYLSDLNQFARYFEGVNCAPFEARLITAFDLRTWREVSLLRERLSPATWNRRRASLALFSQFAQESGLITHDPMQGVQSAEMVTLSPRWLTAAEFGRLMRWLELAEGAVNTELRKATARRDAAMIGLMLFAGLRVAEVVSLEVGDIELSERKGLVTVRKGKGGKRREVPLSAEARRLIAPVLNPPTPFEKGDRIFPITTRAVEKRIKACGAACKVADLTPHRYRHTNVKRMLDAGMDPVAVQRIAGHAKFATTAGYAEPGWEDLERAVEGVAVGAVRQARQPEATWGRKNLGGAYVQVYQ